MFMSDKIYLINMTRAIAERYFKGFVIDPAVFLDGQSMKPFQYSDDWLTSYLERYKTAEHLAIMLENRPIGEILFKRINHTKRTAVFSIHLQNDSVKGKGYGTIAEKLAIEYAFDKLELSALYADAVKKNGRSIRVLEKVGFQFVKEENDFVYYVIYNPKDCENRGATQ